LIDKLLVFVVVSSCEAFNEGGSGAA